MDQIAQDLYDRGVIEKIETERHSDSRGPFVYDNRSQIVRPGHFVTDFDYREGQVREITDEGYLLVEWGHNEIAIVNPNRVDS